MPDTLAARVQHYGEALFGPDWVGGLARLADVNPRTLARIKGAVASGEDYPAARGVLAALWDVVKPLAAELEADSIRADRAGPRDTGAD